MYICNDCRAVFITPYENNIDAGIHYDAGIIGRNKVPTMRFCPNCMSRGYRRLSKECEERIRNGKNSLRVAALG